MRKIAQMSAALALVAVTAACGGRSVGASGSAAELNFVAPSANPAIMGTIALGVATGTFDKAGVKVGLSVGSGAQAVNVMVAKQADLSETSASNAGSLEARGKDISAVWATSGGGLGVNLYASAKASATLDGFKQSKAGNCVMGVTAPGSSGYGYGTMYNEALGLGCKLLELGDTSQIVGAVLAGRVDLLISGMSDPSVRAADKAQQLRAILRSTDPQIHSLGIPQFPERMLIGLKETLDAKRDAVTRFVTGMKQAAALYTSMPADEIADRLLTLKVVKDEYPAASDRQSLIDGIADSKSYVNWTGGHISRQDWQLALDTVAGWGVKDFDPKEPARSYDRIVDMSFYDGAAK